MFDIKRFGHFKNKLNISAQTLKCDFKIQQNSNYPDNEISVPMSRCRISALRIREKSVRM